MSRRSAVVIGSGFSGLSTACVLAKNGFAVTMVEKNNSIGGRARKFQDNGFTFDMGPSWYWMPDIFENFFNYFGKKASDYYTLRRLDPSYRIIFDQHTVDVPADYNDYKVMLESIERGSGKRLDKFIEQAAYKYKVGINKFAYKPSKSISEFLSLRLLLDTFRLDLFQSFENHINKYFSHPKIKMMMEFPILFLGAIAKNTPALYSLMNYADIKLGTWYPEGGMFKIIEAMEKLAIELDVKIITNADIISFSYEKDEIKSAHDRNGNSYQADVFISSADYHYVEQTLLPEKYRTYSNTYWEKKTLAPSSLIFYLGVNKKINKLLHHNLFFDADFKQHSKEIYTHPSWPENPLFYVCAPSKTDSTVAPEGYENLFILIPVAPGIKDEEAIRDKYYELILKRLQDYTGENLHEHVVYKKSFAHNDFINDYNAYKGNAYGLANTLTQTAFLKPKLKNQHLENLYFTGQLTVPGPGVPPSIISGRVVANEILTKFRTS